MRVSGVRISPSPKGAELAVSRPTVGDVAVILVIVVLVRAATFWYQVVDWDVGLYLVVAREVLHGQLPYVSAWEYRPPGLFFLLASALAICKSPGVAMAVLGIAAVSATSLALYAIGLLFGMTGRRVGLIAALLYATISIEDGGLTGNTEILFAPLLCWAVFLPARAAVHRRAIGTWSALGIGLLLGGALQMKLMVVPEAAFVLVLAAAWARCTIPRCAVMVLGAVAPFALEAVLYAARHQLSDFLDANAFATVRRIGMQTTAPRDNLARILAQPFTLLPASLLLLVVPFAAKARRAPGPPGLLATLGAWLGVEVLTILSVREFNVHQFLQLLPALSLLAAYGAVSIGEWLHVPRLIAVTVVLASFALHGYYQVVTAARYTYHRVVLRQVAWRADDLDRVVDRLRLVENDPRSLFVFSENPILYVLADAPLPTRYPFSFYLTDPEMWPLTGVDGRREVARVLASGPHYIVTSDSRFHVDPAVAALLADALRAHYTAIATYGHDTLFRRRS